MTDKLSPRIIDNSLVDSSKFASSHYEILGKTIDTGFSYVRSIPLHLESLCIFNCYKDKEE